MEARRPASSTQRRRRSRKGAEPEPLSLHRRGRKREPGGSSRKSLDAFDQRAKAHKSRPAPGARGKDAPAASSFIRQRRHPHAPAASSRRKPGPQAEKGAGLHQIPASAGMTCILQPGLAAPTVIPAKAGIPGRKRRGSPPDPGLRRDDGVFLPPLSLRAFVSSLEQGGEAPEPTGDEARPSARRGPAPSIRRFSFGRNA